MSCVKRPNLSILKAQTIEDKNSSIAGSFSPVEFWVVHGQFRELRDCTAETPDQVIIVGKIWFD